MLISARCDSLKRTLRPIPSDYYARRTGRRLHAVNLQLHPEHFSVIDTEERRCESRCGLGLLLVIDGTKIEPSTIYRVF